MLGFLFVLFFESIEKKNVPSSGCPLGVSASSRLSSSLKSKAYFLYALNSPFSHADLPLGL